MLRTTASTSPQVSAAAVPLDLPGSGRSRLTALQRRSIRYTAARHAQLGGASSAAASPPPVGGQRPSPPRGARRFHTHRYRHNSTLGEHHRRTTLEPRFVHRSPKQVTVVMRLEAITARLPAPPRTPAHSCRRTRHATLIQCGYHSLRQGLLTVERDGLKRMVKETPPWELATRVSPLTSKAPRASLPARRAGPHGDTPESVFSDPPLSKIPRGPDCFLSLAATPARRHPHVSVCTGCAGAGRILAVLGVQRHQVRLACCRATDLAATERTPHLVNVLVSVGSSNRLAEQLTAKDSRPGAAAHLLADARLPARRTAMPASIRYGTSIADWPENTASAASHPAPRSPPATQPTRPARSCRHDRTSRCGGDPRQDRRHLNDHPTSARRTTRHAITRCDEARLSLHVTRCPTCTRRSLAAAATLTATVLLRRPQASGSSRRLTNPLDTHPLATTRDPRPATHIASLPSATAL